MRITSLSLEHIRNYSSLALAFSQEPVQAFIGENGMGKTNILEAVALLSLTKSFRGNDDADIVQWSASFYRVRAAVIADDGTERSLEIVSEHTPRKRKAAFVNDAKVPMTALVGVLPTVSFLPEDLSLFRGSPMERRRFVDQLLCQVAPGFLQDSLSYQRILKQRNALLKRIAAGTAQEGELQAWDLPLCEHGARIVLARLQLLEVFNAALPDECASLGLPWKHVRIELHRSGKATTEPTIVRELLALCVQHRERDIAMQTSSVGPHRDDWMLHADGRPLPSFASRGQERLALLALLFLEVSYLELKRGERPVILFDDVFSELDEHHRLLLLKTLEHCQVLLTSTHLPPSTEGMTLWSVEDGKITSKQVIKK